MTVVSESALRETLDELIRCGGNKAQAAKLLKLPEMTFKNRLAQAEVRGIKPSKGIVDPNDLASLRGQIKRLETELRSQEKQTEETALIKEVIGNLARQVEALDPPQWLIRPSTKLSAPGVPTLFLSDLHWGERVFSSQINGVNEYSLRIAHERMETCIESAIHLLGIISPRFDYPGIVLPLGGDMISGNIHEELTATNELNSMPTVLDLYGVLVGVITSLADKLGAVFLPCVSGNHGRDTTKIWAKDRHATSFDWLMYRFLAKRFEADKRITFFIPDGSDAYYKVYDHAYLLTHGDQFRGGDGVIGVMGPIIRGDHKKRSRNAQIDMDYATMIMGHFHQYVHHGRFIINGSLKGYDEYAYANNFPFEPPQQALWLTHPKYKITYRMPVYVDRRREPLKTSWVSVPK
ncbi:MAG: hypothetical protein DDT20_00931 [Firmicutes bacterium]|nr:hypothetical protein [Bacillota bacterium]